LPLGIPAVLSFGAAAMIAACGGGGSCVCAPPPVFGSPPPQAPSTSVPFAAVGQQFPLPGIANYSESITVPNNNQSGTTSSFVVSLFTQPFPPLIKIRNSLQPHGAPRHAHPLSISPSGGTPLLYLSVESPVNATFSTIPAFQITVPQSTAGQNYFMALWDPTTVGPYSWQTVGQFSVSGSTLNFAGAPVPMPINAGGSAGLALFSEPVASPTPASPARIYIANPANNTVTMYDQNGNVLNPSGGFPNLSKPYGLAYDTANSHLYVFNLYPFNNNVTSYDKNGTQIALTGTFPNAFGAAITFDSANDELYVANGAENSVTAYDQNGNQITVTGSFPSLNAPQSLAFDSANDHLYVVNGFPNYNITEYDQNGNQITPSGSFALNPLCAPSGIAFDPANGELYVTNLNCASVNVFDQQGDPITPTGQFSGLNCPGFITFDSANGEIYITNTGMGNSCEGEIGDFVNVYDPNGNQISTSGSFPNLSDPAFPAVAPF
jgi:DNA-binding beta-propeller fold protein YncE